MNSSQDILLEKINHLNIDSLIEYLQDNGWYNERNIDNRASIWVKTQKNKKFCVLIPMEYEIPDFLDRMLEVFKTLEFVEQRAISEILSNLVSVAELAAEKQREILTLKLKFLYEQNKKEVSAKKIGLVLETLQDLFDAVGQEEAGKTSKSGKIQKEIVEKTELSLFETFKGSFGVKLALAPQPPKQLSLLHEESTLAEKVIESFLGLIKRSNQKDREKLKQQLIRLKRRSASRYRKFLMSLINSEANIYIHWGSINKDKGGKAELSFECAVETIDFINKMETEEPDEYAVNGELIAANKIKNTLEIEEISTGKKYSGKISDRVIHNKSIELTIGRFYSAIIEEISSINPATGEEKTEMTIIDLAYLLNNQA